MATAAARRIIPSHRKRDLALAICAGLGVLAFILYAVSYLSRQADAAGGVEGVIVSKEFVPQPETQITFGQDGLRSRAIAGQTIFALRVARENGRVYKLLVDPSVYASHQPGDTFYFIRPPTRRPAIEFGVLWISGRSTFNLPDSTTLS